MIDLLCFVPVRRRLAAAALALPLLIAATGCRPSAPADVLAAPAAMPDTTCKAAARERLADRAAQPGIEAAALAAAASTRGAGSPALWSVSDADTTLYIFGTVHLLKPDLAWRSPQIDAAIGASRRVVFEADTESPEAARALMGFFSAEGLFQDGQRLTSLLAAEEVAELEAALEKIGLPLDAVEPMRPWYAALNMSVMQITQRGFVPESGVEQVIEAAVAGRGASFGYLETVEQQLGEFAGLTDCEQIAFLMLTADGILQNTQMLDLLIAEWADGDIAGVSALMSNPESFGSEAIYAAMLKNRNARWVPLIKAELDRPGTGLIAVGAGHLAGKDSVIEMLRAEGLAVSGP